MTLIQSLLTYILRRARRAISDHCDIIGRHYVPTYTIIWLCTPAIYRSQGNSDPTMDLPLWISTVPALISLITLFFLLFIARRLRVPAEERASAWTPRDCGVTCKQPRKAKTAKTVASSIRLAPWSGYDDDDWRRVTHRIKTNDFWH